VLLFSLLEIYFPETKSNFDLGQNIYIREIQSQIVNELQTDYNKRIIKIKQEMDLEQFQEEIYIRSNIFKREIPKVYNNTCCISGMRVDAIENVSMIDACHIIPFSESYNDTISNGIALCPNLHRAFDRGLLAISNDYIVQINNIFNEPNLSMYNLKQFDGVRILLPENAEYHPSIDAFSNHRRRFNIE
jgi:putative restriction endonuclease